MDIKEEKNIQHMNPLTYNKVILLIKDIMAMDLPNNNLPI